MLILNRLNLIKNKIISIRYNLTKWNNKKNNYYIYNSYTYNIVDFFELLNSLSVIYLYIHKYVSLKQKILLYTNYFQHISTLKSISSLTSNYYIYNNIEPGIFTNWIIFKKKLIVYKWLEYFFFVNLYLKNNYKNTSFIYNTLYMLYLKLKLKYKGIKHLTILPKTFVFITTHNNNKYLKELIKLNKNIINISDTKSKYNNSSNLLEFTFKYTNFSTIQFILNIMNTAIFHGLSC